MSGGSEGSNQHSSTRTNRKLLPAYAGTSPDLATSADHGHHHKDAKAHAGQAEHGKERRSRRRALISAPVRVQREVKGDGPADDISTTLDVSRGGILFVSSCGAYVRGMDVKVTFPYSKSPVAVQAEQEGRVVRVTTMDDGRMAVAITLESDAGAGTQSAYDGTPLYEQADASKPLVMVVDADPWVRSSLSGYLGAEGYEVIALSSAREAQDALETLTPKLLIAEIEGEDLPGYALCAHVKATPRLEKVPVMLTTSSAYPSDYSNAHSLGAVVCMAKPYRQERLGHVVRLLAPTPEAARKTGPVRPGDPQRRYDCKDAKKKRSRFHLYR
jgi:CheY-like chemotaxis protein